MMYAEIARVDKTLRPYQQAAKNKIFAAWDECDNVLFQMPTGTGKTRLFTSIISDIKTWGVMHNNDVKVLIIAHRIELIEQISESLQKYKVAHGIIAGGKERELRYSIQVASIQTITHHCNQDIAGSLSVDYIIIDEAHHSTAHSYRKLWELYPTAKKLGVTATPWRMNHNGFTSVYDKFLSSKSIKDFIAEGWLSPYMYYSIKDNSLIHEKISSIEEFDMEGDYKVSALERVVDRKVIRANLLNSYLKLAKGKKGIIYSVSRKHSDHICDEFKQAGINIVRIDSKTPKDERRLYVQRFKKGFIDIIVNVDIFSEGFDCPDIEFIQLARPTKSLVKYLQQVGRGLRPTNGKTKCIILDNVGSHLDFHLPDSERDWEREFVGEPQQRKRRKSTIQNISLVEDKRNLDEGKEEMDLIQDIEYPVSNAKKHFPVNGEEESADFNKFQWRDADDTLLKTLYVDRQCSIELIATVFNFDEVVILERLKELHLLMS